jgi:uncharacterized protein YqgC (DUF456 family)
MGAKSVNNCNCAPDRAGYLDYMSTEQVLGLSIAMIVMFIGLAGSILPGIPSTPVVMAAAVGHKLYFGPMGPAWWVLLILGIITSLSLLMDYLTTVYGAKKMGATWRGAAGAVVGALIGIFFSLPGLILGPFLGAMAFEMAGGRDAKESSRAGVGAMIGLLAGAIGKVACCIAMMAVFTVNVIYRSTQTPLPQNLEAMLR